MKTLSDTIMLSSLRLISMLALLNEKDVNNKEIAAYLKEKYGLRSYSKETMKLDMSMLRQAGFVIKRGHPGNDFRFSLIKDAGIFRLSKFDCEMYKAAKEISINLLGFYETHFIRKFYEKISHYFTKDSCIEALDFKHFGSHDISLLQSIYSAIQEKRPAVVSYSSNTKDGRATYYVYIQKIIRKDNKHHLYCYFLNNGMNITLPMRKVTSITLMEGKETKGVAGESYFYDIKKQYYEKNPIENYETIVKENKNSYTVEAYLYNKLFAIQRIIQIGKNCTKIHDENLKKEVISYIEKACEVNER